MSGKLKTNPASIDSCAGKVKGLAGKADGMRGKLSAAEVPDDAWGLIGQLVVGEYRSLLADFRDFLNRMAEGTGHAGERLGESAAAYREADESAQQTARQLKSRLGGSK
ncbi:WXG100 family type VII secretion target [Crossiella cryophila]|uniref:Uncharacterized protein YukE n=1 Tax=Crossiella cryophila TaxID=43355 RepID=A0A7W7CI49_9PSEU|nr:hypothetical protein [Crossiella cryophila]MBB4681658.1 uncharacterized protein YukE [Crossiella cryophila]